MAETLAERFGHKCGKLETGKIKIPQFNQRINTKQVRRWWRSGNSPTSPKGEEAKFKTQEQARRSREEMLETQQCGKQRGGCSDPHKGQDMTIRKTEGKEQRACEDMIGKNLAMWLFWMNMYRKHIISWCMMMIYESTNPWRPISNVPVSFKLANICTIDFLTYCIFRSHTSYGRYSGVPWWYRCSCIKPGDICSWVSSSSEAVPMVGFGSHLSRTMIPMASTPFSSKAPLQNLKSHFYLFVLIHIQQSLFRTG